MIIAVDIHSTKLRVYFRIAPNKNKDTTNPSKGQANSPGCSNPLSAGKYKENVQTLQVKLCAETTLYPFLGGKNISISIC